MSLISPTSSAGQRVSETDQAWFLFILNRPSYSQMAETHRCLWIGHFRGRTKDIRKSAVSSVSESSHCEPTLEPGTGLRREEGFHGDCFWASVPGGVAQLSLSICCGLGTLSVLG